MLTAISTALAIFFGYFCWILTIAFGDIGSFNGFGGSLTVAAYWSSILLYAVKKFFQTLNAGSVDGAVWILAAAPLLGLANFALAFAIALLMNVLIEKDFSLYCGLAISAAIWILVPLVKFLKSSNDKKASDKSRDVS